jgi:LPXTG-motif cell wall-anchored protein
MTTRTRFLTGGLATLAVASAVSLTAPAASAADQPDPPCGQAAAPAVYLTVVHEPELRQVPAVSHDEWRWERDVTSYEYEFTRVVTAAFTETDWTRVVAGTTEHRWTRTVIERAAVTGSSEEGHFETVVVTPAVTVTLFEYVQQQTGMTRWERDGWNGEHGDVDNGKGWIKTGKTFEDVLAPAVTEQRWHVDHPAVDPVTELSHVEFEWAATSPGDDWTATTETRTVGDKTESTTTTGDDVPAGEWTKGETHVHDAVMGTAWALEASDGDTPTGESRVHDVTTEQTSETSATAPEGDGWTQVADSEVTVVDQPMTTEIIGGGSERQLIRPAQPATGPCAVVSAGHAPGMVASVADHASGAATVLPATVRPATVLPETGSPVSPVLVTAGLGALLAGGVLVRVGRRRQTS